ncbi:conserved Plasmodium protein, unknown function [Plasmodium berghei]|uniref:TOM1-like protein, putative n=2 Tax=Plasmodium berghei TaxID=5821 RepID=A0A509AU43_PLABA|nr:TOM1-like protein, putative [Plasmodium berghei ANKA]CXJ11285.1 conserved Plasmodium protein, unknown function [Plasmodium berghei]SCM26010.1 conserved Plasmodium protein, unknown function [Plasmodium berghei]SCN28232.1 conserved Plasmodium protein, unknown function [Plasmodium berghei]SCO62430.1 conserved Plasmodium protein, unknown function [Plasmodium berghei]SCO63988.1 conserved Plasmodium protein, unknown function [Plasmodium berghei]|eukprot:XP_034423884.1 TOM1-like protein, putative [Plasmodium berghei ANKA]
MDIGGIRKRKDAKDNKINLTTQNNIYNNNVVISDRNLNVSNFPKENNSNWKYNENTGGGMPSRLERNSSDGKFKFGKKKSMKLFNSSNITALSNACIKSFNNLMSNINNSNNSSNYNGGNSFNGRGSSRFSLDNKSYDKQTGAGHFSKGVSYLSNMTNAKSFFGKDNNNNGKDDFNFFRNYENNVYNNRNRNSEGINAYGSNNNNNNNNSYGNNAINKSNISTYSNNGSKISNTNSINSSNLENFLNNKEILNEKYQVKGFGNNHMSEINNLRNITSDETYYICLDNLLRNHGNIDSNEMLKYNDKNINCLNDIIFLDIYRAYNVLTYMQEKVNIIIYTIKIIGKKLKKKHVPEEVVISLEFLNFCVKNLGLFFIRFIDESFMKKISALLKTTTLKKSITKNVKSKLSKFLIVPIIHPGVATDPRLHFIKRKILFMLQLWHDSFILYQHIATTFFMEYRNLKEKGITFPIIKKSEKFFVKNAENSPSFSDDNILHELPLNLAQINNIIRILKEIKNMDSNDSEKYKCINVISKYSDQILLSINKLSDYKGNINISVTLNSLLYINDQICIFEKMKIEREKETEFPKDNEQQMSDEKQSTKEKYKNRKEKKKKKKNTLPNMNEIIFNKFDPWNTENIPTNDKPGSDNNDMIGVNDELFFNNNGLVDRFNKMVSAENFPENRSSNTINNNNNNSMNNSNISLNSNENVFSFFSQEKPINEPTQANKSNEIDDIYSVFNELKFNDEKEQETFNNDNKNSNNYMPQLHQDNFIHNNVLNGQELQAVAIKNLPIIIDNTTPNIMRENNSEKKKIDKKESILEDQLDYLFTNKNEINKNKLQNQKNQSNKSNYNSAEITNNNLDILNIDNIIQNNWNGSINVEKSHINDNSHIFHNDIPEKIKNSESMSKIVSKNSIPIDDIDNDTINIGKSNVNYDIEDKIYENLTFSSKNSEQSKGRKNSNNMGFIPDKETENVINNIQEERDSNNNNKNYDDIFEAFDFNLNDNKITYPNVSDKNIHILDDMSKINVNCTEENDNVLKTDKKDKNDKINTQKDCTSFSDEYNGKTVNQIHDPKEDKLTNSEIKQRESNILNSQEENKYNKIANKNNDSKENMLDNDNQLPLNNLNKKNSVNSVNMNKDGHNDKSNNIHNEDNDISLNFHKNQQNSKNDQDSDDINIDDIDEITKAIDDLNYNFENMNIYKYDN